MEFKKLINLSKLGGASDAYTIICDEYNGDGYSCTSEVTNEGFSDVQEKFTVQGTISPDGDVFIREDTITNTSEAPIQLKSYKSRFTLPGDEYEVFTLYSSWQNESDGGWQPLRTSVIADSKANRANDCNVPMLAIYDKQTQRGIVFHVIPNAAWSIRASRHSSMSRLIHTVIDISICDEALAIEIAPGESFKMPTILYYDFTDKLSLDTPKLHRYLAKYYPRKQMPVIYNTWLAFFSRIDTEKVLSQIDEAADLGCEYFSLDAGWFGESNDWSSNVGNWVENTTGAYCGRMREISDRVHAAGMKFGLWLEGERALIGTPMTVEHPEYFFFSGNYYFLNYAYEPAREYITNVTLDLVEKYNIDFFKFDFNASITYDPTHKAFREYFEGYNTYINDIRAAYPDIYLECCAAGGYRTNLETLRLFDSYWFTDNQSVHGGMQIYKNCLYHILPSSIEKWAAITVNDGFTPYPTDDDTKRLCSTNSANWLDVISTTPSYLNGFFAGGPIGITTDLRRLDAETKAALKEMIAQYKKEAPFWTNASCKLLSDTKRVLTMQYENGDTVKVVVLTEVVIQEYIMVYPDLPEGTYTCDGVTKTAEEFAKDGVQIMKPKDKQAYILTFTKA